MWQQSSDSGHAHKLRMLAEESTSAPATDASGFRHVFLCTFQWDRWQAVLQYMVDRHALHLGADDSSALPQAGQL